MLGGAAHCAQAACIGAGGEVVAGDVCTGAGDVAGCDALGMFERVRVCPAGQVCQGAPGSAACAPGARPEDDGGGEDTPGLIEPPVAPGEEMGAADMGLDLAPEPGMEAAGRRPPSVSGTGESCAVAAGEGGAAWWAAAVGVALMRRRRRVTRG